MVPGYLSTSAYHHATTPFLVERTGLTAICIFRIRNITRYKAPPVPRKLFNSAALKQRRRELRNQATKAERILWQALRKRRVDGFKFRRQQSVGPFIVDFYCPEAGLVVEIDGSVHEHPDQSGYDLNRTDYLEGLGLRVVRFSNQQVQFALRDVLKQIAAYGGEVRGAPGQTKFRKGSDRL